jgi:hypothetical protein
MKLFLSALLWLPLAAAEVSSNYGDSDGKRNTYTCSETAPCIDYTVEQGEPSCQETQASGCEFTVCWTQNNDNDGCAIDGDDSFSHIGDMARGDTLCKNSLGPKGYWDRGCNQALVGQFANVCQKAAPGEWVHFLTKKGGTCVPGGKLNINPVAFMTDSSNMGTTAYCSPSASEDNLYPGGAQVPTFFDNGSGKGTCSGNREGKECVFSVKMPETCSTQSTPTSESTSEKTREPTSEPTPSPTFGCPELGQDAFEKIIHITFSGASGTEDESINDFLLGANSALSLSTLQNAIKFAYNSMTNSGVCEAFTRVIDSVAIIEDSSIPAMNLQRELVGRRISATITGRCTGCQNLPLLPTDACDSESDTYCPSCIEMNGNESPGKIVSVSGAKLLAGVNAQYNLAGTQAQIIRIQGEVVTMQNTCGGNSYQYVLSNGDIKCIG